MSTEPYSTEREAHAASWHARQGQFGAIDAANHAQLTDACAAAGVELGAYDEAIIEWLARWEPATVTVITGLIGRAHEAGQAREHPRDSSGYPCRYSARDRDRDSKEDRTTW